MAQQYSLKWNNHQPNFISMFAMLRNTQALVDVTLAAEGRHLHAHKMVLSACSPYFHSLFVENPSQHPIVILKDVAFSDLRTIVDFMYYGEVNITQEELPQMLHSAKSLKVKGLTETESTSVMRSHSSDFPFETSGEASGEPSGEHTGETLNELSNDPSNEPAGGDSQRKITASPCNSPSAKRRRRRRSSTASTSLNIVCDENRADNQMEIVRDGITLSSVPRTQQSVCPPPLTSRNEIISGRVRNDVTAIHRDLSRWFGLAPSSSRAPAPTVSDVEDKNAEPQNISIDDLSVDHNPAGMPQDLMAGLRLRRAKYLKRQACVEESVAWRQASEPSAPPAPPPAPAPALRKHHSYPQYAPRNRRPRSAGADQNIGSLLIRAVAVIDQQPYPGSPAPTPRASHTPAVRSGPPLSCNFCWNTVDECGRILRRKTQYHCPECRTNLCIVPCFHEYHEAETEDANVR